MPPELRMDAEAAVVGRLDLTIQAARPQKVVSLPMDKEFRGELAASRKKKAEGGEGGKRPHEAEGHERIGGRTAWKEQQWSGPAA